MPWPRDINPELDVIERLVNSAREAEPIAQPFQFNNVRLDSDLGELRNSRGCHIYIFELADEAANAVDVRNALIQQKLRVPYRKYPKVNLEPSRILYVGSSQKNIYGRVQQHLDGRSDDRNGTYALKLGDWMTEPVNLHVRNYGKIIDDEGDGNIEASVLQIVEDSIAQNLRPMFGKQGGNGR